MKRNVFRAKTNGFEEGLEEVESLMEFKFHGNDFFVHRSINGFGGLTVSEFKTGMKIDSFMGNDEVTEEILKGATLEAMARLNKVTKEFIDLAIDSQLQIRGPANT